MEEDVLTEKLLTARERKKQARVLYYWVFYPIWFGLIYFAFQKTPSTIGLGILGLGIAIAITGGLIIRHFNDLVEKYEKRLADYTKKKPKVPN